MIRRYYWFLLLMLPLSAWATSLDDLIARGELHISVELGRLDTVIAKQEVPLWIDIKTQAWFAGGSRVVLPEIAHVVVAQPSAFAINSSLKEAGKTWTLQRWALSLYPQQSGVIKVPPIAVQVSIKHPIAGIVTGEIYTKATVFNVVLPRGERDTDGWLATPRFTLERSLSPSDFKAKQGESLQLTVVTTADNLMPMMLPPYHLASVDGMAVYPQLPQLKHNAQRGDNTAIRRDRFDIVIEREGEYLIPATEYRWWNTEQGEMQTVRLPALKLVSGEGVVPLLASDAATLNIGSLKWLVGFVVVLLLGLILWRRYLHHPSAASHSLSQRQLRKHIRQALKQARPQQAVNYLYIWLDQYTGGEYKQGTQELRDFAKQLGDERFHSQVEALLEAAYAGNNQSPSTTLLRLQLPRKIRRFHRVTQGLNSSHKLSLNE